jgi:hypothetical protein
LDLPFTIAGEATKKPGQQREIGKKKEHSQIKKENAFG